MHFPNTVRYLDPSIQRLWVNLGTQKLELEIIVLKQLENLDALGERAKLLQEQNKLLLKVNHKLIECISNEGAEPKPYPKGNVKVKNSKKYNNR